MNEKNETVAMTEAGTQELEITRTFDAPRPLVWRCWTEEELFKQWYGPKGFTVPHCSIDLQVGGKFLIGMRSPDGHEMWSTGTFREVQPVALLVKTESMADANGNVVDGKQFGMPLETLVTVALEEEGAGQTRMTLRHAGLPEGHHGKHAGVGWQQAFDKLADVLAQAK